MEFKQGTLCSTLRIKLLVRVTSAFHVYNEDLVFYKMTYFVLNEVIKHASVCSYRKFLDSNSLDFWLKV